MVWHFDWHYLLSRSSTVFFIREILFSTFLLNRIWVSDLFCIEFVWLRICDQWWGWLLFSWDLDAIQLNRRITKTVHNFLQCLFSVDLNILRLQIEFKVCQSQQNRVVFFLKKNKQANREAKTTRYLYVCRSNAFWLANLSLEVSSCVYRNRESMQCERAICSDSTSILV